MKYTLKETMKLSSYPEDIPRSILAFLKITGKCVHCLKNTIPNGNILLCGKCCREYHRYKEEEGNA